MSYTMYTPLNVWLDPASVTDVVAYIQTYLSENTIYSETEIETLIHDYLIAHPELIGGVQSVNGKTGTVVLSASNINTENNVTIESVLASLSSQISTIAASVATNTANITSLTGRVSTAETDLSNLKSNLNNTIDIEYNSSLSLDILNGYWSTVTGVWIANGSYKSSVKFRCPPNATIISSNITGEAYVLYWTDDEFIKSVSLNTPVTIPSNAKYCAIDFVSSLSIDSVDIEIETVTNNNINTLISDVDDLSEYKTSKNLFNGEYLTGYYSQMAIIQSDSYCRTKPISLKAGSYLFPSTQSEFGQLSGRRVWILNEMGGIASTIDSTAIGTVSEGTIYLNRDVCKFTLNDDSVVALNIGVVSGTSSTKAQPSNFMIVSGETLSDFGEYEPYFAPVRSLKPTAELTEKMVSEVNGLSGLLNKESIFDGDSICAGTSVGSTEPSYKYGWAGRIGTANKMNWTNYGIDGGVITSRSNTTITSSHSVVDNIDTMYAQHPNADFIIIEGGTNDADQLGADSQYIGTITPNDFSGSYDITTFVGALETIFYKSINYWKGAKIGFIVAQKMGTNETIAANRKSYFDKAIEVCAKWGIPVINLWEDCYLNPNNPSCYNSSLSIAENIAQGYLYTDGQHLTAKGYDYISPIIENWMKSV